MAAHRINWQACKRCKRSRAEVAIISTRGHCPACSELVFTDALMQRMNRSGPVYEKWARGVIRFALSLTGSTTAHG